jgi:Xaa-Pro aminopeptidase
MATEVLPDDRALRNERRVRALAQMKAHDLDVLVLGQPANVRYVTGAHLLWLAGSHPFSPTCVLVRATEEIHLLSTWDEGVPDDIPHERLFGITWNPMNVVEVLRAIRGATDARRVGTDGMSPGYARMLPMAFPAAQLVDGELAMREARRVKTAEELVAIRDAIAIAENSLAAAVTAIAAGIGERELAGVLLEAAAGGGVATPAVQDVAWLSSREHPGRRADGDGRARPGDLMAITAGVVAGGYIVEIGRTWPVPGGSGGDDAAHRALFARWDRLWERLSAACRPGTVAAELLDAYRGAGEALPPMPVAHGLGLGFDPPVVTEALPATAAAETLEPGMVLAVTGHIWEPGVGAVVGQQPVLITPDGHEVLSSAPFWR